MVVQHPSQENILGIFIREMISSLNSRERNRNDQKIVETV